MDNRRILTSGLLALVFTNTVLATSFQGFGKRIDDYIKESAKNSRVSEEMLRGLIKMEDGWTGKSSPTDALGVGQFTVKTWNWLAESPEGKAIGMKLITPYNRGSIHDPRKNDRINTLATGLLARWHIEQFPNYGIKNTHANLYMAHNIGLGGYYRALNGRATLQDIKNMRHNGMKPGMSVRQFLNYQRNRYQLYWQLANYHKVPTENNVLVSSKTYLTPSKKTASTSKAEPVWVEPTPVNKITWVNPL